MISEADIEKAVDFLRDKAGEAAEARAQAEHLDHMRKVMLARLASEQEGSEAAKERLARCTPEYVEFLEGLKEARRRNYEFINHRIAATSKIDAWRTEQASHRSVDRVG